MWGAKPTGVINLPIKRGHQTISNVWFHFEGFPIHSWIVWVGNVIKKDP